MFFTRYVPTHQTNPWDAAASAGLESLMIDQVPTEQPDRSIRSNDDRTMIERSIGSTERGIGRPSTRVDDGALEIAQAEARKGQCCLGELNILFSVVSFCFLFLNLLLYSSYWWPGIERRLDDRARGKFQSSQQERRVNGFT